MIRFHRDSLPSVLRWSPGETWAAIEERVRRWIEEVERALRALPLVEVRRLTVVGGTVDLDIVLGFTPQALLVGGALVRSKPGVAVTPGVAIDWVPAQGGARIRSFSGLTSGTYYDVTLLAFGGG